MSKQLHYPYWLCAYVQSPTYNMSWEVFLLNTFMLYLYCDSGKWEYKKNSGWFQNVWFTTCLLWFRIQSKIPPRRIEMAYRSTLKTLFLACHQLSSATEYWFWWAFGMNQNSCTCLYAVTPLTENAQKSKWLQKIW